jgi:hypothetical protein
MSFSYCGTVLADNGEKEIYVNERGKRTEGTG